MELVKREFKHTKGGIVFHKRQYAGDSNIYVLYPSISRLECYVAAVLIQVLHIQTFGWASGSFRSPC